MSNNLYGFATSSFGAIRGLRGYVFAACTLAGLSSLLSLLQPYLTSRILAGVTGEEANGIPLKAGVLLLLALALMFFCNAVKKYMTASLIERIGFVKRSLLMNSLLSARHSSLRSLEQGAIVNRIVRDTEIVAKFGVSAFVELPADLILVFGCIVGLLWTDWVLFVTIAVFVVLSLAINVVSSRYVANLVKVKSSHLDELAEMVNNTIRVAPSIQNYRVQSHVNNYYSTISNQVLAAGKRVGRAASLLHPASSFLMQLGFLVVVALGGYRVMHDSLETSTLVAFFLYLTYMLAPLSGIGVFLNGFGEAWAADSRTNEVLLLGDEDSSECPTSPKEECVIEYLPLSFGNAIIALRSVSFAYGEGPEIISNLDFSLPDKGLTVLRGSSGVGKSTLIRLLSGQEIHQSGSIQIREDLIDGEGAWVGPNRLLVVPQEYLPWGETIRDTLTFQRSSICDERILELLHQLNLSEWFDSLEHGLDTKHAALDEKASGGELKRLNILRAMLLKPRVLILDEPTANLDSFNSKLIVTLVNKLRLSTSVLVVTHDSCDWNPDYEVTLKDYNA